MEVVPHVQQLLSQAAEGGQEQAHGLISRQPGLGREGERSGIRHPATLRAGRRCSRLDGRFLLSVVEKKLVSVPNSARV